MLRSPSVTTSASETPSALTRLLDDLRGPAPAAPRSAPGRPCGASPGSVTRVPPTRSRPSFGLEPVLQAAARAAPKNTSEIEDDEDARRARRATARGASVPEVVPRLSVSLCDRPSRSRGAASAPRSAGSRPRRRRTGATVRLSPARCRRSAVSVVLASRCRPGGDQSLTSGSSAGSRRPRRLCATGLGGSLLLITRATAGRAYRTCTPGAISSGDGVVVDLDDGAVQAADGDDLVAGAERRLHLLGLAAPLLLRADHHEVHDAEEQDDHEQRQEAAAAAGRCCERH